MLRFATWTVLLAALIAAAVWFADRPGTVTLNWEGWRVDTSVAFLVFCVAAIATVYALIYRFWLYMRRAPGEYARSRRAARRERGYKALTQGMVAVAAGDTAEAARLARRADALLNEPPLTMLLSAQAAQLSGDEAAARRYFSAMLERPDTAFLGLRGLLIQAQRDGDEGAALDYARRAYEQRPKTPWVLTALFDLLVRSANWREALSILDQAVRRKAIDGAEAGRRKVVVLLGCSAEAEAAGDAAAAVGHARKAYDAAPDSLPAVLRLVSLMVMDDKARPASRIIHNAWTRTPHPELARIYGDIGPEQKLKKYRRMEKLAEANPEHRESHLSLAAAALEAELWAVARNHLENAMDDAPSSRLCRLMAALEEHEHGDPAAARQWLLRAASAAADPAWVCGDCGAATGAWAPLCAKCGAFATLDWTVPSRPRGLVLQTPGDGEETAATVTRAAPLSDDAPAVAVGQTERRAGDSASRLRLIDVDEPAGSG